MSRDAVLLAIGLAVCSVPSCTAIDAWVDAWANGTAAFTAVGS